MERACSRGSGVTCADAAFGWAHAAPSPRPPTASPRAARAGRTILGCSTAAGDAAGVPRLRTNAASSSLSVPVPAACPWPRPAEASLQEFGVPLVELRQQGSGLWEQLRHLWQQLTREGELPPELRAVALFSDGPGVGKAEPEGEEAGPARLWRHQGLKF